MNHGFSFIQHFIADESGKGFAEYGLMLVVSILIASTVLGMKGAFQLTQANAFNPSDSQSL
jgi:Flp pilus assembly pilin Flp